jgi:hypothetical protein
MRSLVLWTYRHERPVRLLFAEQAFGRCLPLLHRGLRLHLRSEPVSRPPESCHLRKEEHRLLRPSSMLCVCVCVCACVCVCVRVCVCVCFTFFSYLFLSLSFHPLPKRTLFLCRRVLIDQTIIFQLALVPEPQHYHFDKLFLLACINFQFGPNSYGAALSSFLLSFLNSSF